MVKGEFGDPMGNGEFGIPMGNGEWGINGGSAANPDISCPLGLKAPALYDRPRCCASNL